ncbi:MAG: malectin domain-containing carbohydrate-binding protein [Bryobacteraceae bacterium]
MVEGGTRKLAVRPTSASFETERAELDAVLASGIFQRAPTLAKLLAYICEEYFQGETELIKEYNIAVEALGRPADFDPKKDSIVRVEAHRLRRRLREYYETEGTGHSIRIELPLGAYVPQFVRLEQAPPLPAGPGDAAPPEEATAGRAEGRAEGTANFRRIDRRPRIIRGAVAATVLLALTGWLLLLLERPRKTAQPATRQPVAPVDLAVTAAVGEIRIAAGSPAPVRDRDGQVWVSDRYFSGGRAASDPDLEVAGTLTPELFRTWREGQFRYEIPLKPGTYELTLWFCEPRYRSGADNARSFRISINGKTAVTEFDILTDAGAGQTATARVWRDVQPAGDGMLHLDFAPLANAAILSALSVMPGTPGRLRPIRIAAREEPYTDTQGRLWSSDRFFFGGRLVKRIEPIQGSEDPELYRGERYGRLTYTIPVPPDSTYTALFHFAETWFGSRMGGGGEGSRLFDILCNGLLLERNFDVYRSAGGPFRVLRKTYRGLKPTPNGKLVFQLVPSRNYAFLNALEILDEGTAPAGRR